MNRSFIKILTTGAIAFTVLTIFIVMAIASSSSIGLLRGVNTLPSGTAFVPRQAPAMISLLANPEQLYGIRQVTLPLSKRQSDRQEWQQWTRDNFNKLGLNYQQLKPWLGELTLAVTALDYDRNLNNGVQPGYLLAAKIKNTQLAKSLENFRPQKDIVSIDRYKGANIVAYSPSAKTNIRSSAIVGNFVLFANHPQIIREAINQAQAVNLNLEHSDKYLEAIANITQPRIAIAYIDVPKTLAWSNKSGVVEANDKDVNRTLSAFLSIERKDLVAHTTLSNPADPEAIFKVFQSLLKNSELERVFEYLFLQEDNPNYIDLTAKTSSATQTPFYEVAKSAIKGLFPHLNAIAVKDKGSENKIGRTEILFKLDT